MPIEPASQEWAHRANSKASAPRVIDNESGERSADALVLVRWLNVSVDQDHQIVTQLILGGADDLIVEYGLIAPLEQVVSHRQVHSLQLCQSIY
jgi:hypothetical protein